jgi:hypothetical protein
MWSPPSIVLLLHTFSAISATRYTLRTSRTILAEGPRNKFLLCRAMPRTWQPQRPTGIALPQRKAHDTFRSFQYGKHHLCISCLYELTVLSIATLC